jgi:hypothetical protein
MWFDLRGQIYSELFKGTPLIAIDLESRIPGLCVIHTGI